jgi:hypothetical protein
VEQELVHLVAALAPALLVVVLEQELELVHLVAVQELAQVLLVAVQELVLLVLVLEVLVRNYSILLLKVYLLLPV